MIDSTLGQASAIKPINFSLYKSVMSGLAYNGVDEATGRVKWNGCANVKLRRYEFSLILKHY